MPTACAITRNCTVPNAGRQVRLFNPEIQYLIIVICRAYPSGSTGVQAAGAGRLSGGRDSHSVNGFDVRNMQRNHGTVCRRLMAGICFAGAPAAGGRADSPHDPAFAAAQHYSRPRESCDTCG